MKPHRLFVGLLCEEGKSPLFCCDQPIKTTTKHSFNLFNSIQLKKLIIPQGAILLWSWRAHKKYIKLREQDNKQKSLDLDCVLIGNVRLN